MLEEFISIGFVEIKNKLMRNIHYDLGRGRFLSIQNLRNPNEMVWIYSVADDNENEITDLVCVYNYDYDGYLGADKIKMLITAITGRKF